MTEHKCSVAANDLLINAGLTLQQKETVRYEYKRRTASGEFCPDRSKFNASSNHKISRHQPAPHDPTHTHHDDVIERLVQFVRE